MTSSVEASSAESSSVEVGGATYAAPPAPPAPLAALAELPPLTSVPRRLLKHPRLMHYNRLAALVVLANVGFLAVSWAPNTETIGYASLVNLALAVVVRQQYVINLFFRLATWAPTSWPLKARWTLGKVYHFGGLHVGGALAGAVWFLAGAVVATVDGTNLPLITVSWVLVALLVVIIATALPPFRSRFHDHFEKIHRFGGWSGVALFWTHTLLGAQKPFALGVLAVVTFSVVLPWLRLRKVAVRIERPSTHVVLARFDHGVTPSRGPPPPSAAARSPSGTPSPTCPHPANPASG